ncbi:MAG: hypothetical protein IJI67_05985 [Clostridia bacterium]|nr:hypothetical protein [Clostridia bacterium]
MKSLNKVLALLLSVVMIVGIAPVNAFANIGESKTAINTEVEETDVQKLKVKCEDVSLRDEYTKVFQLEDETYFEVKSLTPLHIKQDGEWVEAKKISKPGRVEDILEKCEKLSKAAEKELSADADKKEEKTTENTTAVETQPKEEKETSDSKVETSTQEATSEATDVKEDARDTEEASKKEDNKEATTKKAEETTTEKQTKEENGDRSGENPKSAPVVEDHDSTTDLTSTVSEASFFTKTYLNDGTSGTSQSAINKYNLLLLKYSNVAAHEPNEVTISSNLSMSLAVTGTTPGMMYLYENDRAMENVSDSDYSNFNYIRNRKAHLLDLITITNSGSYSFDITDIYNRWGKGISDNNGLTLMTASDYTAAVSNLSVTRRYRTVNPFNNESTYHTVDMGLAGMVYIDDFTGSVVMAREETGFSNGLMPVEITRIIDYGVVDNSTTNVYGNNAHINYEGRIKKITSAANSNTDDLYAWQYIDGRTIYFSMASNASSATDVYNEGFSFSKPNSDYSNATVTGADNTVYVFDDSGYLVEIRNPNAGNTDKNKIKITYFNNPKRINYIQDGQLRRYYFNYGNNSYTFGGNTFTHKVMKNITAKYKNENDTYSNIQIDSQNAICSYEYEAVGNNQVGLKKVTYPDSSEVNYSYSSGVLSTIKDVDGRRLTLHYSISVPSYKVTTSTTLCKIETVANTTLNKKPAITEYVEEVVNIDDDPNASDYQEYLLKSSLSIDSSNSYQRVFTNHIGEKEVINYDYNLKPVTYIDENGNTYHYKYDGSGEIDNLVLINKNYPSSNLINNGDISGSLNTWTISAAANVKRTKLRYLSESDNYVIRMNGDVGNDVYAYQVFDASNISADSVLVVGADGFVNAPINNNNNFFGLEVYSCSDSSGSNPDLLYSMPFDSTICYERQSKTGAFTLENTTNYIMVKLLFSKQDNIAFFDNIFCYVDNDGVVKAAAPVEPSVTHQYGYNADGMVTSHIVTNGTDYQAEQFAYNANNSITSRTDFNGETTTYDYDANTSLLGTRTNNMVTNYTYNPIGLLKTVNNVVSGLGNDPLSITKSFSYEGNKISSVTQGDISYDFGYDSFGNVKSIDVNNSDDNTQSVAYMSSTKQDADTNVITYASGDSFKYVSDDGKITQISVKHTGESDYSTVANYEYYASGKLKKLTDVSADRVVSYAEDGSYTIVDGLNQNPYLAGSGGIQLYSYKPVNSNTQKVNMFDMAYTYRKNEDTLENGNKKLSSTLKYKVYQPELTFTNPNPGPDDPETIVIPEIVGSVTTTQASTLMKDCFGRTQSVKTTATTSDSQDVRELSGAYTYVDNTNFDNPIGDTQPSSSLIKTYDNVFKKNNNEEYNFTFSYSYDTAHRVKEISYVDNLSSNPTTVLLSKYTYDVLGQLLTEYDNALGEYNEYSYDNKGNILTKTMYDNTAFSFNNGQITHPAEYSYKVITYTYDTSVYNKLSSYVIKKYDHDDNSNSEQETTLETKNLTYDALGNLYDYTAQTVFGSEDYDLVWEGDKLVLAAADDFGYTYKYDSEGRVIRKTKVDSNMTPEMDINYLWKGDILDGYQFTFYESYLTVTVKNLYDEDNHLIGLNYHFAAAYGLIDESQLNTEDFFPNDSIIWLINDGQGNVIGMYNDTGEINFGCSYDAGGSGQYELSGNYMDELQEWYEEHYPNNPISTSLWYLGQTVSINGIYSMFNQEGYRGQAYDPDLGLVLCNGRYYSPFFSRFINANPETVMNHVDQPYGTNMYAYCFNNPVNYKGDYEPVFNCGVDSFKEIKTTAWACKYFD